METLSNSVLTVQIAEHGAELQSIKKDGKEYLWQGDAKFWGRRSPVLFPIVGRVWNNKYAGDHPHVWKHQLLFPDGHSLFRTGGKYHDEGPDHG